MKYDHKQIFSNRRARYGFDSGTPFISPSKKCFQSLFKKIVKQDLQIDA